MRIDNKPIYDPTYDNQVILCNDILMKIMVILCFVVLIPIGSWAIIQDLSPDHLTMESTIKFEIDGQIVNAHMSEIIDHYIEKNWLDAIADEGRE